MGFSETFFERIKKGIGKMKENISRELTDTRKKTAGIYEKAESEILKSVSETGKDMLDDTVKNQKDIVSAQSLYASEKVRIEKKRKEQSEALARAEYEEKLASAKDSAKAAKLIREENFRLEKSADEEYLEQLKSAAEKEKQVRSEEFSALKNSLDLGYITQSEYYSRLAGLRDKYFEEDSDEWVKYTKQINNYQISSLNDLKDYISDMYEELDSLKSKTEKKLSNYTSLYTKRKVTYKKAGENGRDLVFTSTVLNNLDEETEKLREYTDALEAVRKRGELPEGFFKELRDMSIDDGMDFAKALLDASDSEFEEYIKSYAEKQAQIAEMASELTEAEAAEMISKISSELEKYYDSIPEGFFECGKLSGESFTAAFLNSLSLLSEGLNGIFPDYGGAFSGAAQNNSYSPVFNLYSTAQTASEQLREARAASELERIRGGY